MAETPEMRKRPLLLQLLLVVVMLGWAEAAWAYRLKDNVSVGGGLRADIYMPDRRRLGARRPVVVYVHGGGWIKGDRKKVYSQPEWLTDRGYVFVSVQYRPVPTTTIDGQVRDVATALKWVRRNIRRYGGNGRKVVAMGHSAGAHLVSLVAARNAGGKLAGIIANDVQAYDVVAYNVLRGSLGHPYDKAFGNDPNNWVRWSPATYARQNRRMPPHLIMHSGSQRERRRQLAWGYANLLKGRGTRVEVFDGGAYTHGSIAKSLGKPNTATKAVERFLRRVAG